MNSRLCKRLALLLFLTASALAQSAPESSDLSVVTQEEENLMNAVLREDLFIITTSRLALERSQNDEVKAYAQTLIEAHTQMSAALMALSNDVGLALNGNQPSELPEERLQEVDELSTLEGDAFDARYLELQDVVHQSAVEALEQLPALVSNPGLQYFVNTATPIMTQHLNMTHDLGR